MCSPVRCRTCHKTTWAGCGNHIDAVKAGVPADQWCDGQHSDDEIAAARAANPGFFARLFGR
jgi:hypothetical protein